MNSKRSLETWTLSADEKKPERHWDCSDLYICAYKSRGFLRMCHNRYSNPGVARAGGPCMSLSLIKWKSSSRRKAFFKNQQNQVYFLLATAIFQVRRADRHFHHQCSHLDKGLVSSGALCQKSHSWQQETAGALDLWVAATCSDGAGDPFRCARCRWEKLRFSLMLWDLRCVQLSALPLSPLHVAIFFLFSCLAYLVYAWNCHC